MNTSQPVSSYLQSVSFQCLSNSDIRALSVRRITSPTTFDSLLNPVPGGLYTPELGQFADNACATCGLKNPQCPGHPGHIELPVPCYHPTFMDQMMKLVNAGCIYCGRLRLSRVQVYRISCKLRLIRHGLLKEAHELDQLTAGKGALDEEGAEQESDDESDEERAKVLISRRNKTVEEAIALATQEGRLSSQKTEATSNARQAVIREFIQLIGRPKKCHNCQGINHKYRKDGYVKIFRKPLSEKERMAMVQAGIKAKDPLVLMRREKLRSEKGRKRKRNEDEGVADMDRSSEEDDEAESEESDDEPEIAGGNPIDDTAGDGDKPGKSKTKAVEVEDYLNPSRIHASLVQLFEREQDILSLIYGSPQDVAERDAKSRSPGVSPDMFFIRSLLVPPNRYRPENRTSDGGVAEAQENQLYKNIISQCDRLVSIEQELSGKTDIEKRGRQRTYADFENSWVQLQESINSLIDKDRNPNQGLAGRQNPDGVKQKLEKKEGMFRKYMMGKRVNFAARTVLSPDPNIETNEIGVPPVFAIKLTYPEPVTNWNVEELQEAVRNGPYVWPGAVAIESENGMVVKLDRKNAEERTALANQLLAPSTSTVGIGARGTRPKKVHRHLNNGDIVIMNRQPTLHKPSMMCHRARVLPGEKTLRMHYANCNTYNADFDGDEMNMHFPQNELARAEALSIADTDHQYLSGTAGNPLRGLIQDHISMAVWLTNRDTFFERSEYMQLLYAALRPESGHCSSGKIETVPPAIFKPTPRWTGKQVITSVLKNITPYTHQGLTMSGKSTTDKKLWGPEGEEEQIVVVKDGYLCHGIIDKKQIGPSSGGLVNALYEAYGHTIAGRVLSVLGRLLTRMLQIRAFSCGVEDLVFTKDGEDQRREALAGTANVGLQVAAKYVSLETENPKAGDRELKKRLEDVLRDDSKQMGLDQLTNSSTKDLSTAVTARCLPGALIKPFPKNQMQAMTSSGAKGSQVNANQISCNLGQQVLEGRRVPVMVSGKTLPCFAPFETSVRAGGYIVDRFLTGVRPQEYYFHAMAGREGLIDTAVKTSRSGYLQRCLVKGMEGLKVDYDTSVRDTTDGSLIQFLYGEDGLDVAKAKYLSNFTFTAENYLSLFHSFGMRDDFARIMSEEAAEYNKKAEKKYLRTGDLGAMDPALAVYSPSRYAGSTSERILRASRDYAETNPDKLIRDKKKGIEGNGLIKKNFQAINDIRYLKSIVEAGEAVGVVAGQSVGEPSTQMTLNTFHLAGHSAKNVTLGIPRLREIVMTAARVIPTPTMTLRCRKGVLPEQAKVFAKSISKLSLAEVLDKVRVTETVGKGVAYQEAKKYQVKLEFFPREEYEREYAVTVDQIAETLERKFLPTLQTLVRKEIKKRGDERSLKASRNVRAEVGKSSGTVEQEVSRPQADREGGNDDSDAEGDDDATRDKAKRNAMQGGYEAIEDDEETAMREQSRREASVESVDDETYGGSPRPSPEPGEDAARMGDFAADRQRRIQGNNKTNDVVSFSFNDETKADRCRFALEYDSSTTKILMLPLVESAVRRSLIQSVPGLGTCILDEETTKNAKGDAKGIPHILTSGVNIPDMWHYSDLIDPEFISTNSIYDMLMHYGVEAGRNSIVRELQAVFGGHGISVDPRHLTLIADYMTRDGVYQPFNRLGYRGNVSPFMKMSFETTVGFLKDAVLDNEIEELKGPSSRIVVGGLSSVGTGGFGVFMPVRKADDEEAGDVSMKDEDDPL